MACKGPQGALHVDITDVYNTKHYNMFHTNTAIRINEIHQQEVPLHTPQLLTKVTTILLFNVLRIRISGQYPHDFFKKLIYEFQCD